MKLLIRPLWIPGESWLGYLLRIANRNGMVGFRQFLRNCCSVAELNGGEPSDVLRKLGITHACPKLEEKALGVGHARRHHLRFRYTAICSECLRTDRTPFFRALWESPLEAVCRVHGTDLQAQCPRCQHEVDTARARLLHCRCGLSFLEWPSAAVSGEPVELREILGAELPSSVESLTFRTIPTAEQAAFVLLCRLTRHSGLDPNLTHRKISSPRVGVRFEVLRLAERWFAAWPKNFQTMVADVWAKTSRRLGDLDGGKFQAFPRVQAALSEVPVPRAQRARGALDADAAFADIVSLSEIISATGFSPSLLGRWARNGTIDGVMRGPTGYVYFSRAQADRLIDFIRQTVSVDDAAVLLGIKGQGVCTLIRAGLLSGRNMGESPKAYRIPRKMVSSLRKKLVRLAAGRPPPGDPRLFTEVIRCAHEYEQRELTVYTLRGIADGRVPLYVDASAAEPFATLSVDAAELRRYRKLGRKKGLR